MKVLLFLCLFTLSFSANAESFYDFKYKDSNGKPLAFSEFKGKVVILTNIATKCGFTGQLDDLEKVYSKYKNKKLIVVGVPSNNFLGQTPEDNKEVGNICRLKYGATFPILEKQDVIGSNKTAVYKWVNNQPGYEGFILWNFEKFIIDKNGKVVERFRSKTNPQNEEFLKALEKYL